MGERQEKSGIVERVFVDLRLKILKGELAPGVRLPAERELAAQHQTNRNTLREAIRKLEHAHLVTVRHGQGVTVSDFRRTGTIELIGPFLAAAQNQQEGLQVLLDLLAVRLHILELAVALAARRAKPRDLQRLADIVVTQLQAFNDSDRASLARTELEFLDAVVEAAHSLAVRWVANTLLDVYRQLSEPIADLWVIEPTFPDYLKALLEAFARNDPDAALKATHDYYQRSDERLLELLELPKAL